MQPDRRIQRMPLLARLDGFTRQCLGWYDVYIRETSLFSFLFSTRSAACPSSVRSIASEILLQLKTPDLVQE